LKPGPGAGSGGEVIGPWPSGAAVATPVVVVGATVVVVGAVVVAVCFDEGEDEVSG
jgi:hypothetical protein